MMMKRLVGYFWILSACSTTPSPREPASAILCTDAVRTLQGPSRRTHSPLLFEISELPASPEHWRNWLSKPRYEPTLESLKSSRVLTSMNAAERFAAISAVALEDIVAKPGHMITRAPENIRFFTKDDPFMEKVRVKKKPGQPDRVDRAVLNVITDSQGRPVAVDAWDGHHRLLGAMLAWQQGTVSRPMKLSDLPSDAFEIHVNGVDVSGKQLRTTPPAAGVDFSASHQWKSWEGRPYISPSRAEARFADIYVNGSVSNWTQGSRFTLADLLVSNLQAPFHVVAVARSDLGTPPKLSFDLARDLQSLGVHELLVVADDSSRIALTKLASDFNRALQEEGLALRVNVWVGDYRGYVARHQEDSFLRRVQETYITRAPPRFIDLKKRSFEDIKTLGYEAPLVQP